MHRAGASAPRSRASPGARIPSCVPAGGCGAACGPRWLNPYGAKARAHPLQRVAWSPSCQTLHHCAQPDPSRRTHALPWSDAMVTFLKGRRRNDDSVVAVDESGANVTAALEALVARAEAAAEQLRQLAPVMERSAELDTLRERCVAVERQVQDLESLGSRLVEAQQQAERLAAAGEDMDRIQARMGDLGQKVEGALLLREDVERVLSMEGPVSALR